MNNFLPYFYKATSEYSDTKNAFDLALCRYVSFENKNGPTFDKFEHYQSNKVSGNISDISSGFDVKSLSENNEIVPSKKKKKKKLMLKVIGIKRKILMIESRKLQLLLIKVFQ